MIKMAQNITRCCAVPSCLFIAFLLILTLRKSGLTLFLIKFQTKSARTLINPFYHGFVYKKCTIRHRIFRKIETKIGCCVPTILNPTVMCKVWELFLLRGQLLLCLLKLKWKLKSKTEFIGPYVSGSQSCSWSIHNTAYFWCLSYLTYPFKVFESLALFGQV